MSFSLFRLEELPSNYSIRNFSFFHKEQHIGEESSKVVREEVPLENCNDVRSPEPQFEFGSVSNPNCIECARKDLAISEWERKYNQLKKVHAKQSIHFSELYSKHNDLLKTVESINKPAAEESTSSTDIFTPNEVKFLQCMDLVKKNDCTFVHHCLKFAYKNDPSVMVSKTLWGTASWSGTSKSGEQIQHDAKAPLTPEKVRRIKALFADRISRCTIDSVEYADRMKDPYVNRLLAAGIKNLAQKYKQA